MPTAKLSPKAVSPIEKRRGAYYMRLMVRDQPGVIADITAALRDEHVSLESMLQHGRSHGPNDSVPVVLVTHETEEQAMTRAAKRIEALGTVLEQPNLIRIEDF